ncbi:MAG: glycosyltransferase family 2 protein [Gemmatirosa sp.]
MTSAETRALRAPSMLVADPGHPDVVTHVRRTREGDVLPAPEPLPATLRDGCCVVVCTRNRAASLRRLLDTLVARQGPVEQLLVVDASADDASERVVRECPGLGEAARQIDYFRVQGSLAGLTRQRNVALRWVATRLVVFFDDDVELLPGCLAALTAACDAPGNPLVGACAVSVNELTQPPALWRLRLLFGIVPSLQPGSYARSGMSVPWHFLPDDESVVQVGHWMHGCAMVWRTQAARAEGFDERLDGYATAEDLEFSLRMRHHGRMARVGGARVLHLHAPSGRPDPYRLGYMGARNLLDVHRTHLERRTWRDEAYFYYAFVTDTLLRTLALAVRGGRVPERWAFLRGRSAFLRDDLIAMLTERRGSRSTGHA